MAARIVYTPQYVSLAERPNRGLASESLVRAIDEALGAEGVLLALRDQADAARKACRPGVAPSTVVEEATAGGRPSRSPEPEEVKTSKRRTLITLAAAIAFGEHLEEPVARILAADDEPQAPVRVRAGDVRQLRDTWETLVDGIVEWGGGVMRHQALATLRWATAMLNASSTPAAHRETAVMTAKLADTAAWATFDAGHHESARQLSLLGLKPPTSPRTWV